MRALRLLHCTSLVALLGAVLGTVAPAAACTCAGYPEAAGALESADVVFEGTALAEPEPVRVVDIAGYSRAARFRFQVARYFKGQQGSEAAIYTADQGPACGRFYASGSTYVVYGRLQGDGLLTDSLCSRTRLLSEAAEDLALLGEGTAPDPGVQPRDVVAEDADDVGCSVVAGKAARSNVATGAASSVSAALVLALMLARRMRRGATARGRREAPHA